MKIKELIKLTCDQTIKELEKRNKIRGFNYTSYTRTEQLLYLYPYLSDDNEQYLKITMALDKIKNEKYYSVVEQHYFEGKTFAVIADEYNVKYQTISHQNRKLINRLAKILFPNEVAKEILEG